MKLNKIESAYQGLYFDGKSAKATKVMITCGVVLELRTDDGRPFKKWKWNDLREEDAPSGYFRLGNDSEDPLARLETTNSSLIDKIRLAAPALQRKQQMARSGRAKIIALAGLAIVSLIAVVIFGIPAVATRITPLVPLSWEAKLGELIEPQVAEVFKMKPLNSFVCSTPEGDAAVAKMAKVIRGGAELPFEPRIKVIRHKMKNAFALPGGTIYLMQGLITASTSADAVAGVLAHEMGHIKSRDSIRKIAESSSRSFVLSLLLGDVTGSTVVIFAGEALLGAAYSRDIERNADDFAIERLKEAQVSPIPMTKLFEAIDKRSDKSKRSLFSSHPLTRDRIKYLSESMGVNQNKTVLTDKEWEALKTICG